MFRSITKSRGAYLLQHLLHPPIRLHHLYQYLPQRLPQHLPRYLLVILALLPSLSSAFPLYPLHNHTLPPFNTTSLPPLPPSLSKRTLPLTPVQITTHIAALPAPFLIAPNTAKYTSFPAQASHSLASTGFSGCTGLVLASPRGVLIAHFFPTPPSSAPASDPAFSALLARVRALWERHGGSSGAGVGGLVGARAYVLATREHAAQEAVLRAEAGRWTGAPVAVRWYEEAAFAGEGDGESGPGAPARRAVLAWNPRGGAAETQVYLAGELVSG